MPIDQAKLEELKSKYGAKLRIIKVLNEEGSEEFAAKLPTRAEWKRFVGLLADDDTKAEAFDSISVTCVVYPENFEAMLDERPGLAMTIGNKIGELAGLTKRAEAKKA